MYFNKIIRINEVEKMKSFYRTAIRTIILKDKDILIDFTKNVII
ncbi:hypothetical protein [Clostridium sardiniense]|nr:hypothetical protein [Clostridium sardiniense]MBM7833383.1 hypothetical protein [Clostridium sardiniense]